MQPQHQSPEDRLAANEEFSTFEDLDGLTDEVLYEIAQKCKVDGLLPDECVPCRAFVIWHERQEEEDKKDEEYPDPEPGSPADLSVPPFQRTTDLSGDEDPLPEGIPPTSTNYAEKPVVERFADGVRSLSVLVEEMLHGDPVPPPEVTLEEVAALTVGSKKWLAMLDAQGLTLSPEQEQVREAVRAAVAKVQRG